MRKLGIAIALVLVCLVAVWAQEPLRTIEQRQMPRSGGSTDVAVVNFPLDEQGNLLVNQLEHSRVVEQYVELDPVDSDCQMNPGRISWRVPQPPGGPWETLAYNFMYPGDGNILFGVSIWQDHPLDCETWCLCGKLEGKLPAVPGSTTGARYGHVLVMGDELLVLSEDAEPQRLYLKWSK